MAAALALVMVGHFGQLMSLLARCYMCPEFMFLQRDCISGCTASLLDVVVTKVMSVGGKVPVTLHFDTDGQGRGSATAHPA